jgi:hypothetical protein
MKVTLNDLSLAFRVITPRELKTRFDTSFYLTYIEGDSAPDMNINEESTDYIWISPLDALNAHARGEIDLAGPLPFLCYHLAHFTSVQSVIAANFGLSDFEKTIYFTLEECFTGAYGYGAA